ncbi:MAG: hypothetical protein F4Y12_11030 [Acidimicrobiaceae bacterium]|nr:hypothetical protein [Acidimicrobiaceae bacterium]MYH77644.1 hypothetical protein [Acidimicrobiaceae bacterium]MYK77223.1 hypothetical protein [Acidimicrobiaceae bacterium]
MGKTECSASMNANAGLWEPDDTGPADADAATAEAEPTEFKAAPLDAGTARIAAAADSAAIAATQTLGRTGSVPPRLLWESTRGPRRDP